MTCPRFRVDFPGVGIICLRFRADSSGVGMAYPGFRADFSRVGMACPRFRADFSRVGMACPRFRADFSRVGDDILANLAVQSYVLQMFLRILESICGVTQRRSALPLLTRRKNEEMALNGKCIIRKVNFHVSISHFIVILLGGFNSFSYLCSEITTYCEWQKAIWMQKKSESSSRRDGSIWA